MLTKSPDELNSPIARSCVKAARQMNIDVVHYNSYASDHPYVIFFHNHPERAPKVRGKLGWWMCDYRHPKKLAEAENIDHTFLVHKEHWQDYKNKYSAPVSYMPQCGWDKEIGNGRDLDSNIVFIGNFESEYHQNRPKYIRALREFGIKVISGQITTEDQKYIYNSTPICLAVSPQREGYTSNRLYNILSSGGFCLTLKFPGIEDLFENHKHLVWFDSPDDAKEKAEYYLENEDLREEIAENGKRLYEQKHTAKNRLKNMFEILKGDESKFNSYL